MADIVQRIAMKAVIVKNGKVLILREAATYGDGTQHGRYHMPGGRIEPGEHFETALRREVLEETGLKIIIGPPIYVDEWRPIIRGVQHHIIGVFFVCKPKAGTIRLSTEHDDYQWINPKTRHKFGVMGPEDKIINTYWEMIADKKW